MGNKTRGCGVVQNKQVGASSKVENESSYQQKRLWKDQTKSRNKSKSKNNKSFWLFLHMFFEKAKKM
jgi:hypothetical protein